MSRKAHPALQIPLQLTPDDNEKEYEAAAVYGLIPDEECQIDPARNWYSLSRSLRARLLAQLKISQLTRVISEYDSIEYRRMKQGGH